MSAPDRDYRKWVQKAASDWLAVETLRGNSELRLIACLHAQQALEKSLKGLLVLHGKPYPKTHDLVKLIQLTGGVVPELPQWEADLHGISLAYPRSRYRGELEDISQDEAQGVLKSAAAVRADILKHFPADV
jgi:HEPN domain-containing protein